MDQLVAPTPQPACGASGEQNVDVLGQPCFRQPAPIAYDVPMTPPISPGHSENGSRGALRVDQDMEPDCQQETPCSTSTAADSGGARDSLECCFTHEQHPPTPPNKPPRLLEDEPVGLAEPGVLKLSDFEVRGTLGTGTFGRVLLVRLKTITPGYHSIFAMKVLRKSEVVRLRQVEHVNAERHILSRLRHPFVVDLFATFQDSLNIYMLMSYVPGGELFTHLRRARRFTPDVTRFYLANIILALKYLHSFNVIYRDLKPENLLLDPCGYLCLTDFGFAKVVDDRTWTLCGTPEYLAPEIILSEGHGKAVDWWACGILCYEMLVGYPPFFDETPYGIYDKILNGNVHWPRSVDRLSQELIQAFLRPDRSKRLGNMIGGPQDVLEHPWFRGVDWDALERREIKAPIIPHTTSLDDTRHFLHLPFPSLHDMPGLLAEEDSPPLHKSLQFPDF
ncbi:hypothetical protein M404DRAFT_1000959 [Pisolithus tinctorius Marx 270]|uniref:cAMP-dependent protein kinase n=1 Tax=Pisolithus tinctorius Marx 270 TaxID=870435 RepID=A0A0C3P8S8_PISTI|nr:hypothetical protein M404DRAFT_1000959 [Pisolithus tinctorius Marx 270]